MKIVSNSPLGSAEQFFDQKRNAERDSVLSLKRVSTGMAGSQSYDQGLHNMSVDLDHIRQVMDEADCLYNEQQIEDAIATMGHSITEKLADSNPLVFCVMNGGLVITGKLLTHMQFPLEASYVHATRYRDQLTGGRLEWKVRPTQSIKGRTILIIDDILDEGHTLDAIVDFCKEEGAASVLTAVLVDKKHDRKARPGLKADFTGLEIEDRYIFGYGLDYQGYWRNANGIYALKGH